jgi:hypothetical protein
VELLKGKPVYGGKERKELVTPTGAAILIGSSAEFGAMPEMHIDKVGYGAGSRELEHQPNFLRVILGNEVRNDLAGATQKLVMVETCIDDMNPEIFSYLMDLLFDDGALDVFWVPVQMKKSRPGTLVKVLCAPEHRATLVQRILTETSTLGVRFYEVSRSTLVRDRVEAETAFGKIAVKRIKGIDGRIRLTPEFEVCRKIADERHLPLLDIYETIVRTARINASIRAK